MLCPYIIVCLFALFIPYVLVLTYIVCYVIKILCTNGACNIDKGFFMSQHTEVNNMSPIYVQSIFMSNGLVNRKYGTPTHSHCNIFCISITLVRIDVRNNMYQYHNLAFYTWGDPTGTPRSACTVTTAPLKLQKIFVKKVNVINN